MTLDGGEARHVARREHGVGRDHERRERLEAAPDGIRRAERLGLAHEPQLEREPVEQPLDLLGQMSGHHRHASESRGTQLLQQRHDHRPPVDRQHRLGVALGQRPEPAPLACGHHDGLHAI